MLKTMRRTFIVLAFFVLACSQETPSGPGVAIDTREPISIQYVGAPELPVREKPEENAAITMTYQNGEAVSILSEKGEWAEIRAGAGSGWIKKTDLTDAAGKQEIEENPTPKFRVIPMPVSAPSAKGDIYLEASVNTEGEVTDVRIITNTTGSEALAFQNSNALRASKFYPIVVKGERKPFLYYHRITY